MNEVQHAAWVKNKNEYMRLMSLACDLSDLCGDYSPSTILANAINKADDTFKHDETNPDYWRVALGSINADYAPDIEWFKKNGHQF